MEAIQLFEDNIKEVIYQHIKNQEEALNYFIPEKTCAFTGYGNKVNDDILTDNNVFKIDINNEGGTIVSEKGSFAFAHFSKNINNNFNRQFAILFRDYLRDKGINIIFDGNDMLVDGIYKVASYSSRRFGDILFSAFHISYDVNLDLIRMICTKPMKKIPKGFKDYNISTEEILLFFLEKYQDCY